MIADYGIEEADAGRQQADRSESEQFVSRQIERGLRPWDVGGHRIQHQIGRRQLSGHDLPHRRDPAKTIQEIIQETGLILFFNLIDRRPLRGCNV